MKVIASDNEGRGLLIGDYLPRSNQVQVIQDDGESRVTLYFHPDEYRRWLTDQAKQLPLPKGK